MNINIDASQLIKALKIYRIARKDKSYSYIVNRALQNVCGMVIKPTPKADAGKIAREMGQAGTVIAYKTRSGAYKKYKKPRRLWGQFEGTFAARIINKRLRMKGEPMLFGAEMEKKALRMVNARLRSIAFIKSGWLPAFEHFSKIIDKPLRIMKEGKVVGVPKGWAVSAPKGTAITKGIAANNAQGAEKVGTFAAEYAVNETARDMIGWSTDRLREDARKSGFRVK